MQQMPGRAPYLDGLLGTSFLPRESIFAVIYDNYLVEANGPARWSVFGHRPERHSAVLIAGLGIATVRWLPYEREIRLRHPQAGGGTGPMSDHLSIGSRSRARRSRGENGSSRCPYA